MFTGYININGVHVKDGLKNPLPVNPETGEKETILVSDGNPDWRERKFYEVLIKDAEQARERLRNLFKNNT